MSHSVPPTGPEFPDDQLDDSFVLPKLDVVWRDHDQRQHTIHLSGRHFYCQEHDHPLTSPLAVGNNLAACAPLKQEYQRLCQKWAVSSDEFANFSKPSVTANGILNFACRVNATVLAYATQLAPPLASEPIWLRAILACAKSRRLDWLHHLPDLEADPKLLLTLASQDHLDLLPELIPNTETTRRRLGRLYTHLLEHNQQKLQSALNDQTYSRRTPHRPYPLLDLETLAATEALTIPTLDLGTHRFSITSNQPPICSVHRSPLCFDVATRRILIGALLGPALEKFLSSLVILPSDQTTRNRFLERLIERPSLWNQLDLLLSFTGYNLLLPMIPEYMEAKLAPEVAEFWNTQSLFTVDRIQTAERLQHSDFQLSPTIVAESLIEWTPQEVSAYGHNLELTQLLIRYQQQGWTVAGAAFHLYRNPALPIPYHAITDTSIYIGRDLSHQIDPSPHRQRELAAQIANQQYALEQCLEPSAFEVQMEVSL